MDGFTNGDVFALGVNLECGAGTNGCWDRTKVLDGGTLGPDSIATQCPVENNAWGHQAEIKRGQKWTQHKNAVGCEDKVMMLYAKVE